MKKAAVTIVLALCGVLAHRGAARAEYLIGGGDTIDFSVAGIPSLDRKVVVDLDGRIALPLLGQVVARGKTIAALQEEVRKTLPTKTLNLRTTEGRDMISVIAVDEITLSIASYQPIYIMGDVNKTGELPFRPGLTVTQAVALAGGYDNVHVRLDNPGLVMADLSAEYADLWNQYAKRAVQVARINAELAGRDDFTFENTEKMPVGKAQIDEFVRVERSRMREFRTQSNNEKALQTGIIAQSNAQYAGLLDKGKKDQEGSEIDASETTRLNDLNQRGVVPVTRLVDQRRLSLLSSSQSLDTISRAQQALRDRDKAQRDMKKVDEDRRLALLSELQDASADILRLKTRLEAVSEKLRYTTILRSNLVRGPSANAKLTLSRTVNGKVAKRAIDENEVLLPGDVVDVELSGGIGDDPKR